jgi:TonB family protein
VPRGNYQRLGVGTEYPPQARAHGIQGKIRVRLVVDQHGKVTSAILLNRLGYGLDEFALARIIHDRRSPRSIGRRSGGMAAAGAVRRSRRRLESTQPRRKRR